MLTRSRDIEAFEAFGCSSSSHRPREAAPSWSLGDTVTALREAREQTNIRHRGRIHEMPSRLAMREVIDGIAAVLFPTHLGRTDLTEETVDFFVGSTLHTTMTKLFEQARRALFFASDASESNDAALRRRARTATEEVGAALPSLRRSLVSDLEAAHAAHEPDGASVAEILVGSTSMRALLHHRVAHVLHGAGLPFLARLVSELAFAETAVHIHPAARIGPGFSLDRGTGVVIGETAEIGANVLLHQGVTLGSGARHGTRERAHPRLEDDVVVHVGATLLGPITVGARAIIGAGVRLDRDVHAGAIVR